MRLWTPGHPTGPALRAHADRVYGLSLSPDGRTLLSAGVDGLAMAWDLATGEGRSLARQEGRVHRAGFLPDGQRAFTAGQDGALRTWRRDGSPAAWVPEGSVQAHDGAAWWAEPDAQGTALWSVGADRRLVRWDLGTGHLQVLAEGLGARGGVTLRPYRLAGDRVLVCDGRGGLAVFGPDGRRDHALPFDPVCPSLRVSPAGDWVAVPSGGEVHRFDPESGATRPLARQAAEIHAIAISGDGRLLATAGLDGTARIWRIEDGAATIAWRADGPVLGVAFSADGQRLAAAGVDAVLWWGPVDEARLVPAEPAALGRWIRGLTTSPAPALPTGAPPP
ncbi:hypothetical protein L6R53_09040 [Myxococcota bacterium]|nr:hypothetical protein [Myxococcota bacterium]